VVLTSSFAAVGYGRKEQAAPFDETNWTDPNADGVSAYAKSKTLAERAAWDYVAKEGGLEPSVVNPVGVFGPILGPTRRLRSQSSSARWTAPCRGCRTYGSAWSTCATSPTSICAP